jgi:hypothetical protein
MIPTARPASSTIVPVPDVDLKPTAEMAANAKRGLELRRKHGKGGTAVGVARARDLARRANLSPDTVRRMHSFFSRHEGNQAGGEDDAGYIAWLLWGGDAGKGWAERKTKELNKETAMRSDTYKAIASRLGMAARPAAKAAMSNDGFAVTDAEYEVLQANAVNQKRMISLGSVADYVLTAGDRALRERAKAALAAAKARNDAWHRMWEQASTPAARADIERRAEQAERGMRRWKQQSRQGFSRA